MRPDFDGTCRQLRLHPVEGADPRRLPAELQRQPPAQPAKRVDPDLHPAPALAWSDGNQAIGLRALAELAAEARLQHQQGLEAVDATDAHHLLALVEGELERLLEARRRLSGLVAEATA